MKKVIFLNLVGLFFALVAYAQDKVEAPVWNVGDKWVWSSGGSTEVLRIDENSYVIKTLSSDNIENFFIHDKTSLNRTHRLEGEKRRKYGGMWSKAFNFPLTIGKSWENMFSSRAAGTTISTPENRYFEKFKVLGFEDVKVQAGTFKAIKIEYRQEGLSHTGERWVGEAWFWYVPEVKYFVKWQPESSPVWLRVKGWELASFELK